MCNLDIKAAANEAGVRLWEIANECLGITDSHFSRKLRHELPDEEKEKIREYIARRKMEVE